MSQPPGDIPQRLHAEVLAERRPAYLHVDADGRLIAAGGDLAFYGLDGLEVGRDVGEQVDFLAGLFPLAGEPMQIECVRPTGEVYCDVHLVPGDDSGEEGWAVLLDCTEPTQIRQALQQRGNELALLKEKLEKQNRELAAAQAETGRLLRAVVPDSIAQRLESGESQIVAEFDAATVAFIEITTITEAAAHLTPTEQSDRLNGVFAVFDQAALDLNLQPIRTQADCYIVAGGLPGAHDDHCGAVLEFMLQAQDMVLEMAANANEPFVLRGGVATGPVVAGILGSVRRFAYDVWGPVVAAAGAMQRSALPGTIQVTEPVHDALRHRFRFDERGAYYVKGGGEVITYLLVGRGD